MDITTVFGTVVGGSIPSGSTQKMMGNPIIFLFHNFSSENRTGGGRGQSPIHEVEGWETRKFSRSREADDVRFPPGAHEK